MSRNQIPLDQTSPVARLSPDQMSLDQIIILGMIQGLTEFLPISSSGHLVLIPALLGWKDQRLFMDVAVHVGTLGAVLIYFKQDVKRVFFGFFHFLKGRNTPEKHLFSHLFLATCPVVVFGYLMDKWGGDTFRTVSVIAWNSILFGGLLYLADRLGDKKYTLSHMTYFSAFFFGMAQVLSLVNGVSRAGICMTAGRWMGYTRQDAAHFSFLMAIPAILAAASLKGYGCYQEGNLISFHEACLGASVSFLSGFCSLFFMMHFLKKQRFIPFVIYRLILGAVLLLFFCP